LPVRYNLGVCVLIYNLE